MKITNQAFESLSLDPSAKTYNSEIKCDIHTNPEVYKNM